MSEMLYRPPRRRRVFEAAVTFACLVGWMTALWAMAQVTGFRDGASAAPLPGMIVLFLLAFATAEWLVRHRSMIWPGSMLGLVGPICLGFGASMATPETRALPPDQQLAIVTTVSAAAMMLFLFRFRLAALVSPVVTFTVVSLFLSIRGVNAESLSEVEGFSPRGILAALVYEPAFAALFFTLATACAAYARWLDLKAGEFGMAAAKPLHFIGTGVMTLILGRLAGMLPQPLDLIELLALFALSTVWALRIDRIGVLMTTYFAMSRPLIIAIRDMTGGTLDWQDWTMAHFAIMGVGLILWTQARKTTVASGFTTRPRNIKWNWPDRVIYPYRPPPGHT